MPENKKHHYVPRFLLKRFSRDGHSIGLYNVASGRTVPNAALKTQCYSDYLYGKDPVIEKAMAGAEGELATVLRAMDKVLVPPPRFTAIHDALLFLVLSQHGRTKYAAEALDDMFDGMMKNVYAEMLEAQGFKPDQFKIHLKEPANMALATHVSAYPLLWDLEFKVLLNKTNEEFILSDNPIVFYNQLMSYRVAHSCCGLAFKGLQIVVPLDPKKILMFYDLGVYRIGSDSKGVIDVTNPRDVYELNTLQFVNARENIYFSDPTYNAAPLAKKATPFLRTRKAQVASWGATEREGRVKYVGTSSEDVRTNLQLSFVTLRGSAKAWREAGRGKRQPLLIARNEKLLRTFEEFTDAVEAGTYKATQCKEFISAKMEAARKAAATE